MKSFREFVKELVAEDAAAAPANGVGGGAIAGVGIGPQGEPGVPVKVQRKIQKAGEKSEKEISKENPRHILGGVNVLAP